MLRSSYYNLLLLRCRDTNRRMTTISANPVSTVFAMSRFRTISCFQTLK